MQLAGNGRTDFEILETSRKAGTFRRAGGHADERIFRWKRTQSRHLPGAITKMKLHPDGIVMPCQAHKDGGIRRYLTQRND